MTKSIPIHQSKLQSDEQAYDQHDALWADYKDYVFYSRVVEGMRRAQGHTRDVALRYENQALIDHIVRTRHCQSKPSHGLSSSPTSVRNFGDNHVAPSTSGIRRIRSRAELLISEAIDLAQAPLEDQELDQDLIFDMDL
jgi:hypothetical protein